MNKRAEMLAKRIEQGAAELGTYAETLSDDHWRTILRPDGRTVGVVIHHVASMYPIEINLANELAAGKSVEGLTWGHVAEINAKHAKEHASVGKKETLELLRTNSRAAAEAVRGLSDAQLDSAAPLSLNGGAPLTAQFAIEDHALRHAWHHMSKIKTALGHSLSAAAK